jgi:hypothetical protein
MFDTSLHTINMVGFSCYVLFCVHGSRLQALGIYYNSDLLAESMQNRNRKKFCLAITYMRKSENYQQIFLAFNKSKIWISNQIFFLLL